MFQRILVPLDGSPLAEQALRLAVRLAQATGGAPCWSGPSIEADRAAMVPPLRAP